MRSVRLGKTELLVSRVGFGGIPIQRLTEAEAVSVVQRCLDLGVTLLDTANGYTTSEERIGKAIAGRRHQVIIATKTAARDRATALQHLELSLKRLNTDYLDLWQLHNVSTPEAYDQVLGPGGAMESAQEALRAGKIRHIGISSHSLDMALKAVPSGRFETIQFPFNFVTDEAAEELLPLTRQHDVGFIAMKPMAGGMLTDARLAIKHLLQFDNVIPDPGIQTIEEIEEIAAIVNGHWELTPQEWREIERIRGEMENGSVAAAITASRARRRSASPRRSRCRASGGDSLRSGFSTVSWRMPSRARGAAATVVNVRTGALIIYPSGKCCPRTSPFTIVSPQRARRRDAEALRASLRAIRSQLLPYRFSKRKTPIE
jgi:uncharacterized protein